MKIKFYEVGGCVRDALMGIKPHDKDYAVECDSFDEMRQSIIDLGGKIFLETPKYLTIRANIPKFGICDYVLCRKDGEYKDGRRPESVSIGNIYDDLSRREFTINAIAKDMLTGKLIDPFGGIEDIKNKFIRAVGNVNDRFNEDALRAFRAVRFSIQKRFDIDDDIHLKLRQMTLNDFRSVSGDRVRDEIMKMFIVNTVDSFHLLFDDYPVLGEVIADRGIWFKPTTEEV